MIAHRSGFALAFGVAALIKTGVLSHGCDNPLCQRIDPEHCMLRQRSSIAESGLRGET